ncbi:GNAT family N-acetyltransferase [Rhodococcoides yunnanense]|uniref:GNAT family N-acetyltransferase n=1 Tax=Rhodococcoides yunnanense TaxID=278209 RepID=A0ABU4B9A4_9NOCA|nr:GNAT family N-acetyltransferase [Rhodococcus yunnanensis]MDV6260774.1 GNAT family N-acetyltransferase [Rhodococcus yunnanensis]
MSVDPRTGGMELVDPSYDLRVAWLDCRIEWGPGLHEDGFGLTADDDVDSARGFSDWIDRIRSDSDCTYRWIMEGGRILGGIALRDDRHDSVEALGHIGYGVRPSDRGRGIATWAVGEMLRVAAGLGLRRITAVCQVGNSASIRTVESVGGKRVYRTESVVLYSIPVLR